MSRAEAAETSGTCRCAGTDRNDLSRRTLSRIAHSGGALNKPRTPLAADTLQLRCAWGVPRDAGSEAPSRRLSGGLRSSSRAGHGRSPTSSMTAPHSTHANVPSPMGLNASHRWRSVGGCCDALLRRTVTAIVPATHTPANMARLPQIHIAAPLAVVLSKIPRRARGNAAQLRPGRQDGPGACRAHGGNH